MISERRNQKKNTHTNKYKHYLKKTDPPIYIYTPTIIIPSLYSAPFISLEDSTYMQVPYCPLVSWGYCWKV